MADVLVEEKALSGIADAIRAKTGGTATYKPSEMADAISKIEGGEQTRFGVGLDTFVGDVDSDGMLSVASAGTVVFSGVKDVKLNALRGRFAYRQDVAGVEFPDLEQLSQSNAMYQMFVSNSGMGTISFPKLKRILGASAMDSMFSNTRVNLMDFPELEEISGGYAFSQTATRLQKFTGFPKLRRISGDHVLWRALMYCPAFGTDLFPALEAIDCNPSQLSSGSQLERFADYITELRFPELREIHANGAASLAPFRTLTGLARIYLPKLADLSVHFTGTGTAQDSAVRNMFSGCAKLTEIHFGAANKEAVEAMPGYNTLWGLGAGKATVYFDL